MKQRIYHKAKHMDGAGRVSALCFKKPRPINLQLSLWTIRDEAVTCLKCLAIMERQKAADKLNELGKEERSAA